MLTATHITEALLKIGHVERDVNPLIDVHPVVKVLVLRIYLPRESGALVNARVDVKGTLMMSPGTSLGRGEMGQWE